MDPGERRVLEERGAGRRVFAVGAALSLVVAALGALWAYAEYVGRARTPLLGLATALLLVGSAFTVLFTFRFAFPFRTEVEPRPWPRGNAPTAVAGALPAPVGRRTFFVLLGGAGAAILALVLLPLRSLGTRPGETLLTSAWRRGVRLLTLGGQPLRPGDLAPASVAAAVPEAAPSHASSLVTVVRLLAAPGETGPLAGVRAFSRICTHAGCAVAVFRPTEGQLVCPCHRSAFDLARNGAVVAGPASQPLPRLPLTLDDAGYLVADGGFDRAIGPLLGRAPASGHAPSSDYAPASGHAPASDYAPASGHAPASDHADHAPTVPGHTCRGREA